ncbi:MAG: carbohydrate-binding domain-containing protein [Cyanobacteria bacterium J06623_4]
MSSLHIEAEDYGAYFDRSAGNGGDAPYSDDVDVSTGKRTSGGYYVGQIQAQEYLTYTVDVPETGEYLLEARVSSGKEGTKYFDFVIDEAQVSKFSIGKTGGWYSWTTIEATEPITLTAGTHEIRVNMRTGGFNFDSFQLSQVGGSETESETNGSESGNATDESETENAGSETENSGSETASTESNAGSGTTDSVADNSSGGSQPLRIEAEGYETAFDSTTGNAGGAKQFSGDVDVYANGDEGGGYHVGKTAAGEYLEYTINVAESGTYRLNARIASAKGYEKQFQVLVEGQEANFSQTGSTGGWNSWVSIEAAETISLEAGTHTLRVKLLTGGVILNYIEMDRIGSINNNGGTGETNDAGNSTGENDSGNGTGNSGEATDPVADNSSGGSQPLRIEAEDYETAFDSTTGNAGSAKQFSGDVDVYANGDEGGGYHVGKTAAGEYLEYTINVAESGTYRLNARIASAKGYEKQFQVLVEGQEANFSQTGSTGGWNSWVSIEAAETISLEAGTHTLRVKLLTGGVILNYIEMDRIGDLAPPTVLTSVDPKTQNPIEAGGGSQAISGDATTRTVSYRQAVTGITADLDAAKVTYGAETEQITTVNLGRLKVMPLGDSITKGGDDFDVGGYRDDLWQSLTGSGYDVDFVGPNSLGDGNYDKDHAGFGGYRIDELAALVNNGLIATYQPDIVLLMAGTNDNLQNYKFQDAADRLHSLVGDILRESPSTQVFVASIPPSGPFGNRQQRISEFYNSDIIRTEVADQYDNAHFVDVFGGLTTNDLISDNIHLTKEGNTKVANAFFDAIHQKYSGGKTVVTPATDTLSNITNVIGSAYDDELVGNSAQNSLIGGKGDDLLTGGVAADMFILSPDSGFDTITDFSVGEDLVVLSDGLDYSQISVVAGSALGYSSSDTLIFNGSDKLALLVNVKSTQISADSFAITSTTYT